MSPLRWACAAWLLGNTLAAAAAGAANGTGTGAGAETVTTTRAKGTQEGDVERGRLLYHQGLVQGQPVVASRPGLGPVPGHAAACVHCHRPSTLGSTEGGLRVPPIAGPLLFAAGQAPSDSPRLKRQWLRHQTRSAYTPALLARALTDGVDPDGQALAPTMPRYALNDQAVADLAAYLRTRGTGPDQGLHGGALHLATVLTPQASPGRQRAVASAMQAWAEQAARGRLPLRWALWTLQGPAESWRRQLESLHQRQPVYAVLSGAGGDDWAPVDAWCESQRVACLMPVIDRVPEQPLPAATAPEAEPTTRHWNFYLGGGVGAEVRMLAQHLRQTSGQPARLLQAQDGSAAAMAAALSLRQALADAPSADSPALQETPWSAEPLAGGWLVLWGGPQALQRWWAQHPAPPAGGPATRLVLSGQLAPPESTEVPAAWRPHTWWVTQRSDPVRQAAAAALSQAAWVARLQLPADLDTQALADVHAATFFFSDALAQARGWWQAEHLLERLETAVDQRPAGASYLRLSLGPGQRVAAQGGHLLAFVAPGYERLAPLPGYLRAD